MFEAHTLNATESDLESCQEPQWLVTYTRRHAATLRPLRIWFASGKRKDLQQQPHPTWFIYIEYRDDRGNNRFHCLERRQQDQPIELLLAQAINQSLPGLGADQV